MVNLSDFDFKCHLTVFEVSVNDVVIAHVPLGALENFLLCLLHVNRSAKIFVTLVYDSNDDKL